MWFNPAELTSKPSANSANIANLQKDGLKTVVEHKRAAAIFVDSHTNKEISKISEISTCLTPMEHQKLLDYLEAIGETDNDVINELLDECRTNTSALSWALEHADKVLSEKRQKSTI